MSFQHLRQVRLLAFLLLVGLSGAVSANSPAPSEDASRYEVAFMTGMIDHHAMAVEMAELCLQRAMHAELIETCRAIRDTQTQEIQTMQSWLDDWYATSYKPRMSRQQREELRRMGELSGADFEIAFMQSMIEHHQAAIAEAGECLGTAYHRPLIELCGAIAAAQAQEIVNMRAWLCDWYGLCDLAAAEVQRGDEWRRARG